MCGKRCGKGACSVKSARGVCVVRSARQARGKVRRGCGAVRGALQRKSAAVALLPCACQVRVEARVRR